MRFLALAGSERKGGNTDRIVEWAQQQLWEKHGVLLEIRHLRSYDIAPCGSCGDCNNLLMPCEIKDGAMDIVNEMKAADGIIWATPVHAFGPAVNMQKFLERAGVGGLRFKRPLTNKVAGFIVVSNGYSADRVFSQLLENAILNRLVVAGWGMPTVLTGRDPGKVLSDSRGMVAIATMLDRMVEIADVLKVAGVSSSNQLGNERQLEQVGVKAGAVAVHAPENAQTLAIVSR